MNLPLSVLSVISAILRSVSIPLWQMAALRPAAPAPHPVPITHPAPVPHLQPLFLANHISAAGEAHPMRDSGNSKNRSNITLSVVSERPTKEQLVKLYEEHYASLVRLASFLLDDVESCEEVVQDAFVKLYTTAQPTPGKEAAYLRAMVLNGTRSRMRWRRVRKRHVHEMPEPVASAESDAMSRHEREEMLSALRRLPKRQSEVLVLRFYQNLSEAEIADTLGISQGSVKTHASRGLAALKSLLGGTDNDPNAQSENH